MSPHPVIQEPPVDVETRNQAVLNDQTSSLRWTNPEREAVMPSSASKYDVYDTIGKALKDATVRKKSATLENATSRSHRSFSILQPAKLINQRVNRDKVPSNVVTIVIGEFFTSEVKTFMTKNTDWSLSLEERCDLDCLHIDCAKLKPLLDAVMTKYKDYTGEWQRIESSEGSLTLSIDQKPQLLPIQFRRPTLATGGSTQVNLVDLSITNKEYPISELKTDPNSTEPTRSLVTNPSDTTCLETGSSESKSSQISLLEIKSSETEPVRTMETESQNGENKTTKASKRTRNESPNTDEQSEPPPRPKKVKSVDDVPTSIFGEP